MSAMNGIWSEIMRVISNSNEQAAILEENCGTQSLIATLWLPFWNNRIIKSP